jgi:hypothetical protein
MVATGHVAPVNVYDPNLPMGVARPQEVGPEGLPLWVADFMIDDGGERANVVGVRFESRVKPVFKPFARVDFTWLRCSVYVNGKTGQLGLNYTGGLAEGAASGGTGQGQQKAA